MKVVGSPVEFDFIVDPPGNMIAFWDDGASIPTGWTCISCSPGDDFYQRFVNGSDTYGTTGGSDTGTHTMGFVSSSTSATTDARSGTGVTLAASHTHNTLSSTSVSSPTTLPPYRQLRVIVNDVAGEPDTLPAGLIAIFDGALPPQWTQYAAQEHY